MCMGTFDRNVENLSGKYIGSTTAAADDSSAGTVNTGIRSLCTTQTKFHDTVILRCVADAGCFGSNQTLMVHDI